MARFKRNQVEDALSRIFDRAGDSSIAQVRTRVKRLLLADREWGRKRHVAPDGRGFAFYSAEPPGSGQEGWYSEYEAFALLTALRLLEHGWPQGTVLTALRQVRPRMEKEHGWILQQDPARLFDWGEIVRRAQPGSMAVSNTDPVFLCIASQHGAPPRDEAGLRSYEICHGEAELMQVIRREAGQSSSIFELTAAAHQLSAELSKTEPRKRGRGTV